MNEIYQKTICQPIIFQGIGLHSGKSSKIAILPGSSDQGIIFKRVDLKEKSFGFEIELLIKVKKMKVKIFEVAVSYNARKYSEGKKIKFIDALRAFYCLIKY